MNLIPVLLSGIIFLSLPCFGADIALAGKALEPGNMRILYAAEGGSRELSLFSVAMNGEDRHLHVSASVSGRGEYEPGISPDGKRLAFTTYRYGGWKIGVSNLDGSSPRRLTRDPQYAYDPSWSPDGSRLVYRRIVNKGEAYFRGKGDIFIINSDGSGNRNLTNDEDEHARNPAFSPDGKQVVYDAFVGERLHLALVGIDGSGKRRIPTDTDHAFAPSWSPDGKWIAHLRQDKAGYTDVWRMKPDGSAAENLTKSESKGIHSIGNSISHWQYETHWSPDGDWIAFTADYAEKGNIDIYLVDVKMGVILRLTNDPSVDTHPFWYRSR